MVASGSSKISTVAPIGSNGEVTKKPVTRKRRISRFSHADSAERKDLAKHLKNAQDTPLALIRSRYLRELKSVYMMHYEEGLLGADALLVLQNSINEALDRAHLEL